MVGEAAHLVLGVRHPDDRHAVVDELPRETLEHGGGLGIERGGRLVHQHHPRVRRQRARQARALRLATRQLARVAVQERRGQADALEQLAAALLVAQSLGLAQVVEHGAGERHGPLEDHRDLATQRERVALRDVLAAVAHHPLRRDLEAVAQAQERRLARARRAADDGQPAVGQLRVEVVQPPRPGRADADGIECEQRLPRGHGCSIPRAPLRSIGARTASRSCSCTRNHLD